MVRDHRGDTFPLGRHLIPQTRTHTILPEQLQSRGRQENETQQSL